MLDKKQVEMLLEIANIEVLLLNKMMSYIPLKVKEKAMFRFEENLSPHDIFLFSMQNTLKKNLKKMNDEN